jgi:hypothetical protein
VRVVGRGDGVRETHAAVDDDPLLRQPDTHGATLRLTGHRSQTAPPALIRRDVRAKQSH